MRLRWIRKKYPQRTYVRIKKAVRKQEKIFVFILQELQSSVDYTMIFRIAMYIMDILSRYFQTIPKNEREQVNFRLPAVAPVVFYNGTDRWTAVQDFREYQTAGSLFGDYILGLRYYLVDLNRMEEDDILATNTVIDNIMYCDKFRRKAEVAEAVRVSIRRVKQLGPQELAEGRAEGLEEGRLLNVISLLQKKYRRGKTAVEAAMDLEEDISGIQEFYDLIARHPEEDAGSIYVRYQASLLVER